MLVVVVVGSRHGRDARDLRTEEGGGGRLNFG